jgi:hypothetical protein
MGNNIKVLMGALAAGIVPVFAFAAAMVAGKAIYERIS